MKAIICVDDEALIVLALKQELRDKYGDKYNYFSASNASNALELISDLNDNNYTIIIIISDWNMPGMKGDELLKIIKTQYPHIKTVLISGNASYIHNSHVCNEQDNGIDCYMDKPWNPNTIYSLIDSLE